MQMQSVTSSQIAAIGHDGKSTLRVQFNNGGVYDYANVGADLFAKLQGADSVGSFFSANIKKNATAYPFTKVS